MCSGTILGTNVGSNSVASRQLVTFFPAAHTNNEMTGFAVFEKGFTLEDSTTTCSFNAFFPVSGDVVLSGGTLHLLRDLNFKSPLAIGVGTIDGNGFAIDFPGNISGFSLPAESHDKVLELIEEEDVGQYIFSIDWSHDDKYLAVGSRGARDHDELLIYYFEDDTLTLTLSLDLGNKNQDANTVRWHPSDYYLAMGRRGDVELKIFYLNVATGQLETKSSSAIGTTNAVAWSPDGNYIAIGEDSEDSFVVYEVLDGVLWSSHGAELPTNSSVRKNAIDWHSTGSYIALGLSLMGNDTELKVFTFDGEDLIESAGVDADANVNAVIWHPGMFYLIMGQDSSSERLRLYEYDPDAGTLTEKISARVGDGVSIYSLDWGNNGDYLAVGKAVTSASHELRLFTYDNTHVSFSLMSGYLSLAAGYEHGQNVSAVSWAGNPDYVAAGDAGGSLKLFKLQQYPLTFANAELFFHSDVTFRGPVIFQENCKINGGGSIIDFDGGSIIVASDSSLTIEDAVIRGISSEVIGCADDTSVITLRDVLWNQDSIYTFSVGALRFKNDIIMSGDTSFVYASSQTSTLLANSDLELDAGLTFSYDPCSYSKSLIEFADSTSRLILNGATLHATVTGMQLTTGKLRVLRDSYLVSEKNSDIDEGITFGNDESACDLVCDIFGGVTLWVDGGSLNYRNVNASSWQMRNITSELRIGDNTELHLYQSLDLDGGALVLGSRAVIGKAIGKDVFGSIKPLGPLHYMTI